MSRFACFVDIASLPLEASDPSRGVTGPARREPREQGQLYQVIGVDHRVNRCWLRRWPLARRGSPVFEVPLQLRSRAALPIGPTWLAATRVEASGLNPSSAEQACWLGDDRSFCRPPGCGDVLEIPVPRSSNLPDLRDRS